MGSVPHSFFMHENLTKTCLLKGIGSITFCSAFVGGNTFFFF